MRAIARILEALLMLVDPESGHRLIDSQKPKRQPMSDERFEQISELLLDILLVYIVPIILISCGIMLSVMVK